MADDRRHRVRSTSFAPGLFAGRVALVTGAGTGIGRTTALAFARYGADVVLAGRTRETLRGHGRAGRRRRATSAAERLVVPTDIRVTEQVDALQAAAYERFGQVDFLVNNAGGQFPALPSQISDNGWRAVVDLNLNGTWNMVSRFMGPMVGGRPRARSSTSCTSSRSTGARPGSCTRGRPGPAWSA